MTKIGAGDLRGERPVCLECCGGDPHLGIEFERHGVAAICALCEKQKTTLLLARLAELVDKVYRKYVRRLEESEGDGVYPEQLIHHEILGCPDPALADAIIKILYERYEYVAKSQGAEQPYKEEPQYALDAWETLEYDKEWEQFEQGVKHRGRFFLDKEKKYLEKIFRPLLNGDLHGGEPPIVVLGSEQSHIKEIYRARIANSSEDQKRILENPARELSPPPPTFRTAGRMNAAGVVAFYGATDVTTCVAELGVPYGGNALVGRFRLLRSVRVLDFRLLRWASQILSPFDPTYANKVNYIRFMRRLRNVLRKPVLPGTETLDYLPTQMVAEFLSLQGLDGVMFFSSVTPEAEKEAVTETRPQRTKHDEVAQNAGVNIVLFAHAAIVMNDMAPRQRRILRVNPPIEFKPQYREAWYYVEQAEGPPPEEHKPLPYHVRDDAVKPTLELLEINEGGVILAYPKSIEYKVMTASVVLSEPISSETDAFSISDTQ